jgi:hypothetical protein
MTGQQKPPFGGATKWGKLAAPPVKKSRQLEVGSAIMPPPFICHVMQYDLKTHGLMKFNHKARKNTEKTKKLLPLRIFLYALCVLCG